MATPTWLVMNRQLIHNPNQKKIVQLLYNTTSLQQMNFRTIDAETSAAAIIRSHPSMPKPGLLGAPRLRSNFYPTREKGCPAHASTGHGLNQLGALPYLTEESPLSGPGVLG